MCDKVMNDIILENLRLQRDLNDTNMELRKARLSKQSPSFDLRMEYGALDSKNKHLERKLGRLMAANGRLSIKLSGANANWALLASEIKKVKRLNDQIIALKNAVRPTVWEKLKLTLFVLKRVCCGKGAQG